MQTHIFLPETINLFLTLEREVLTCFFEDNATSFVCWQRMGIIHGIYQCVFCSEELSYWL